jgi:N-acetylmuramoyl-L-alanine amidase
MEIKNHLLYHDNGTQIDFRPTPNRGGKYTPEYLVMHYTADTNPQTTISWFTSSIAKASAHLLIARDGGITQFAPFNIVTWHAGKSQWKGLNGLNQHAIGIELTNAGRLMKTGNAWICPADHKKIPNTEVIMATHKNETAEAAWQTYSQAQLKIAVEIAALLVTTYNLKDVIGHDDIAPIRKSDPGPAFPMKSFRSKAMGRESDQMDEYFTSTELNIRSGPGTAFNTLTLPPLPAGTKVLALKTEGTWTFVEVLDTVNGIMDLEGWVSSKYLTRR